MIRFLITTVLILSASLGVRADLVFSSNGASFGSYTVPSLGPNGWQVEVSATVTADHAAFTVVIEANEHDDAIDYIRVTANRSLSSDEGWVYVIVRPDNYPSDRIPTLREIKQVSGSSPVVVRIEDIGQLGVVEAERSSKPTWLNRCVS
jgi:hypothetical protein